MWLKCSLCSKNCFFTLLSAIFFELPITRTPDNSNLFSISLEGSSYRESTVQSMPRFTDTRLIQTHHYFRQFALSLGRESPYIFSKCKPFSTDTLLACSTRSDSRAREKNSRRRKKNEGRVHLNSLPTYRRALLSERLEQANTLLIWTISMAPLVSILTGFDCNFFAYVKSSIDT